MVHGLSYDKESLKLVHFLFYFILVLFMREHLLDNVYSIIDRNHITSLLTLFSDIYGVLFFSGNCLLRYQFTPYRRFCYSFNN